MTIIEKALSEIDSAPKPTSKDAEAWLTKHAKHSAEAQVLRETMDALRLQAEQAYAQGALDNLRDMQRKAEAAPTPNWREEADETWEKIERARSTVETTDQAHDAEWKLRAKSYRTAYYFMVDVVSSLQAQLADPHKQAREDAATIASLRVEVAYEHERAVQAKSAWDSAEHSLLECHVENENLRAKMNDATKELGGNWATKFMGAMGRAVKQISDLEAERDAARAEVAQAEHRADVWKSECAYWRREWAKEVELSGTLNAKVKAWTGEYSLDWLIDNEPTPPPSAGGPEGGR